MSAIEEHEPLFVASDDEQEPNEQELFESQLVAIVGEIGKPALAKLYNKFSNKRLLDAVNYYFDNMDKLMLEDLEEQDLKQSSKRKFDDKDIVGEIAHLEKQIHIENKRKHLTQRIEDQEFYNAKKYLGTLSVDAWCTRSVFKIFPYGKRLKLFVTEDFVKLLDPENGDREIGKIPTELSRYLAPVLLHKICICTVTVIFNDKRLSIGDSFLVQVDIFINPKFIQETKIEPSLEQDRNTKSTSKLLMNTQSETPEEKAQRQRRTCLTALLQKLNLKPFEEEIKSTEDSNEPISLDSDEEQDFKEQEIPNDTEDWEAIKNIREEEDSNDDSQDLLNLNQLKQIYKSTQMNFTSTEQLPQTEPTDIKLDLRKYQKMGLTWLLKREQEFDMVDGNTELEQEEASLGVIHPLWKEYKWPVDNSWEAKDKKQEPAEEFFYYNHFSGELSSKKPLIKSSCVGGILADEMGLGKTISTYSLINTCPVDKSYDPKNCIQDRYAYRTTLIVVPMSLLSQWEREYQKANSNPDNKCLVYYGSNGYLGQDILRMAPTVVITTYGTIQNEAARGLNIGLFSIKFFRVVLDEAHNIRNRLTKTSKSCCEIESNRRWALTGTPIINRLDDVFALIKFLRLSPWDNYSIWNTFVTKPFEEKQLSRALETMESILSPIILRRTKNQKDENGEALVELPPKQVIIQKLKFTDKERAVYDFFKNRATSSLKQQKNILANYTNILTHILRLRQVCCHLDLIYSSDNDEDTNSLDQRLALVNQKETTPSFEEQEIVNLLKEKKTLSEDEIIEMKEGIYAKHKFQDLLDMECSICTAQPIKLNEMVITGECQHCYCLKCLLELFQFQEAQSQVFCPVCRQSIDPGKLFTIDEDSNNSRKYHLRHYKPYDKSSKINALLDSLNKMETEESVVVFSPFSTFLDLIEKEMKKYPTKFKVFKFDGRLKMDEREKVLNEFSEPAVNDKRIKILLLSLKAGGVGLNLTSASRAYLLSPWWAPSVENQAIDRIHRIGQLKNVTVIRFIMENSIEEKMLKIQERKKHLGEVVEADDEEKRKRRIEEIMMLLED